MQHTPTVGDTTIHTFAGSNCYWNISWIGSEAVRLEADGFQSFVELNVTCTSSTCKVTALRHIRMDPTYPSASDRDYLNSSFLQHLSGAFLDEHLGTAVNRVFEVYLYDPRQNPYAVLSQEGIEDWLVRSSAETLAICLGQVLNTCWIIDNYSL